MFDLLGKTKCPNCGHLMVSHTLGTSVKKRNKRKIDVDAIFCEECKGEGKGKACFLSTKWR